MDSSLITSIFNDFRPKFIRLLEKCNKSDLKNKKSKFDVTMPRNVQEIFLKDIVTYLEYNFDSGRLDQIVANRRPFQRINSKTLIFFFFIRF